MTDALKLLTRSHIQLLIKLVKQHSKTIDLTEPKESNRVRVLEFALNKHLETWKT